MDRPLLILSDAHLSRSYGSEVDSALAQLLPRYPDCEVVLAGDIFDLSLDCPKIPVEKSLSAALAPHEGAVAALRAHLARGQKITFIPGNHDAGLSTDSVTQRLRQSLGAPSDESLEVAPWFIRRGNVHIEHGHLYDPDCAPNHPLALPNPHREGLGTALMRRFVAPHDALFLAHKNQLTPTSGLRTAFEKWGSRAPGIIVDYFKTATELCMEAAYDKRTIVSERSSGDGQVDHYSARSGVPASSILALLDLAPQPTHHSFRSTFLRLYFDRIFAAAALGAGFTMLGTAGLGTLAGSALISAPVTLTTAGALLATLRGGYLATNTLTQKNRYGDKVVGQLGQAAHAVRKITQSDLVVFGHTHVEVDEPGYCNLGSFGFGRRGRPYLLVSREGKPERAHLEG
jgi:UDP-2,3-diacylglucosamine pyrophosphatase LpxH